MGEVFRRTSVIRRAFSEWEQMGALALAREPKNRNRLYDEPDTAASRKSINSFATGE